VEMIQAETADGRPPHACKAASERRFRPLCGGSGRVRDEGNADRRDRRLPEKSGLATASRPRPEHGQLTTCCLEVLLVANQLTLVAVGPGSSWGRKRGRFVAGRPAPSST
jgi:hypothetical protein